MELKDLRQDDVVYLEQCLQAAKAALNDYEERRAKTVPLSGVELLGMNITRDEIDWLADEFSRARRNAPLVPLSSVVLALGRYLGAIAPHEFEAQLESDDSDESAGPDMHDVTGDSRLRGVPVREG